VLINAVYACVIMQSDAIRARLKKKKEDEVTTLS
jgi:hypothetical protein